MLLALLLQKKSYPMLVLDVIESLPKSTVLLDGQLFFTSLQTSLGPRETCLLFEITRTPRRC